MSSQPQGLKSEYKSVRRTREERQRERRDRDFTFERKVLYAPGREADDRRRRAIEFEKNPRFRRRDDRDFEKYPDFYFVRTK